jgi:hypothetical protein
MNNTAKYGAGVVLNYTGGEYKNNIVCANYGSFMYGSGSGLWINNVFSRPLTITNNTIAGNSSSGGFSGLYGNGTFPQIRNNIVWGNTGGVQASNTLTIRYSNVQGGAPGAGNINADPMFADSNYILQTASPCVDKGDSSTIYNDIEDPGNPTYAKFPSRGGLRNDMGAYGGPLARILTNQLIGIPGIGSEVPQQFVLYQNYPNPFNPATKITFDLPQSTNISLKIYNLLGKEIQTLANGFKHAGRYTVDFNSTGLASGVYFYKLEAAEFSLTKKMILAK